MFRLEERVAIVTGGGRGLGRSIADTLAASGASIAVVARTSSEIEAVAKDLRSRRVRALAIACDVTDEASVEDMVRVCTAELGPPDIVVNNAGNAVVKPLVPLPGHDERGEPHDRVSDEEWRSILDTHVAGAMHVVRAVGPSMLARRRGRIINISSVTTARVAKFTLPYDTAKGGLITFTRSLANEWARYGITANVIAPGQFPTTMSAELHDSDRGRAWLRARIPMRRVGDPAEVGALALYLASEEAAFITGQCIYIDGGESL